MFAIVSYERWYLLNSNNDFVIQWINEILKYALKTQKFQDMQKFAK